jgi:RloB-like protein
MSSRLPSTSSRPAVIRQEAQFLLIVTEGEVTEPAYFAALKKWLGLTNRVQIAPKQTLAQVEAAPEHTGSSPDQVLACALQLKKAGFQVQGRKFNYDQVWLVLDTEAPGTSHRTHLPTVLQDSPKKGLKVALSRPCFEAWLILHLSASLRSDLNSKKAAREALRKILPPGISADLDSVAMDKLIHQLVPLAPRAVEHARRRDSQVEDDAQGIPQSANTRVHLLVEQLLQSASPSSPFKKGLPL